MLIGQVLVWMLAGWSLGYQSVWVDARWLASELGEWMLEYRLAMAVLEKLSG